MALLMKSGDVPWLSQEGMRRGCYQHPVGGGQRCRQPFCSGREAPTRDGQQPPLSRVEGPCSWVQGPRCIHSREPVFLCELSREVTSLGPILPLPKKVNHWLPTLFWQKVETCVLWAKMSLFLHSSEKQRLEPGTQAPDC